MTGGHISLRRHLESLAHSGEPAFEPSEDPVLTFFGCLFAQSGLHALDANKHLRTGALTTIYDCETESQRDPESGPERFVAVWSPGWHHDDPLTGFRTGRDSVFFGTTPTVAMPQDERTAALLLLVTSDFVHLSAVARHDGAFVQGAVDAGGLGYRFLTLAPRIEDRSARRADPVAAHRVS